MLNHSIIAVNRPKHYVYICLKPIRMSKKKIKTKKISKKLFTKNRLVVLNEDTFEEIFSLRLTLMNVFVLATIGAIVIIFITTYIIAFTPLREFIPGYSLGNLKKKATILAIQSDSIHKQLEYQQAYIHSVQKVLNGEIEAAKFSKDSIKPVLHHPEEALIQPSKEEVNLRKSVQKDEQFSISASKITDKNLLFVPVDGTVIQKYNPSLGFNGIQYKAIKSSAVKAISKGIVIYKGWSAKEGYILVIKLSDGFISVLKGMNEVIVSEKDKVKSGQAIGISGELPIVFELWKDDSSVNPQSYLKL